MAEKASPSEDRAARLAAALRANLHRRKAQARAVARDDRPDGRDGPADQPDQ